MILYLFTIFVCMSLITVFNYLFAFGGNTFWTCLTWVVVGTIAQIIIDAVFATLVRWVLPSKMFAVDKKRFCASKKESIFYEKIGIKKSDAETSIEQVKNAVNQWELFANEAELSKSNTEQIKLFLNLNN